MNVGGAPVDLQGRAGELRAWSIGRERPPTPWRAACSRRQRHPVAAGRAGAHRLRPGVRTACGESCRTPAASLWCRPSPALGPPTGTCTPGAPSWGSPGNDEGPHRPGRWLDAIALQVTDLVRAMDADCPLSHHRPAGGRRRLRQRHHDADSGGPAAHPRGPPAQVETTAFGAAALGRTLRRSVERSGGALLPPPQPARLSPPEAGGGLPGAVPPVAAGGGASLRWAENDA